MKKAAQFLGSTATWNPAMAPLGPSDGQPGRVRAVAFGPDGRVYLRVTNRDGRGSARPSDKILRVVRRRQPTGADAGAAFVR
jgi:hypothetical protein